MPKAELTDAAKSELYAFENIADLHVGPFRNFYCQVVEFVAPRETRGSDLVLKAFVLDDSVESTAQARNALLVQMFYPKTANVFQTSGSVGDIVQFRHMRVQTYQSGLQAISTNRSAYTVFYSKHEQWACRPERPVTVLEAQTLDQIDAASGKENSLRAVRQQRPQSRDKLAAIAKRCWAAKAVGDSCSGPTRDLC